MHKIRFIFFLFLLGSCQKPDLNLGIAEDYYPSADLLLEGIVNKYYVHSKLKDQEDISTHLIYRSTQVIEDKWYVKEYLPDFSPRFEKQYTFQNQQMILVEEKRFFRNDTLEVTLIKPIAADWKSNGGASERTIHYNSGDRNISSIQSEIRDTSVLGLPAKLFVYEGLTTDYFPSDTAKILFTSKEIYVEGLGLYDHKYQNKNITQWLELVEQIPLKKFKKMAGIPRHRVAYIDPDQTMDPKESFETCYPIDRIRDYYNGQRISYYEGGKKAILKTVNAQLNEKKTGKESGYLTFRFVVNCKGEAGRIITEQADLDFQRKEFSEITIQHFYEIFQQLNNWIPPRSSREDSVDAYFYLTFKLKDGKIIELLP